MNLDLLSMSALSICAFAVVTTMASTIGSDRPRRITTGVLLGLWFVGVCTLGASRSIVGGGRLATAGLGMLVLLPIGILSLATFLSKSRLTRIREVNMLPPISVQILRILGVVFVLLYAAHRLQRRSRPQQVMEIS